MTILCDLSAEPRREVCGGAALYGTVGAGAAAPLRHRVPEGAGSAGLVLEVAEVVLSEQAGQPGEDPPVVESVHRVHLRQGRDAVTILLYRTLVPQPHRHTHTVYGIKKKACTTT